MPWVWMPGGDPGHQPDVCEGCEDLEAGAPAWRPSFEAWLCEECRIGWCEGAEQRRLEGFEWPEDTAPDTYGMSA